MKIIIKKKRTTEKQKQGLYGAIFSYGAVPFNRTVPHRTIFPLGKRTAPHRRILEKIIRAAPRRRILEKNNPRRTAP